MDDILYNREYVVGLIKENQELATALINEKINKSVYESDCYALIDVLENEIIELQSIIFNMSLCVYWIGQKN